MSSFTELATKPDWCRLSYDNWIMDTDEGNNYVSGFHDKIINRVYP